MMNVKTKKVGATLVGVLIALCLCLALMPLGLTHAVAYDGLPGEFGSVVGSPVVSGGKTYVNYEGGYVAYNGDVAANLPAVTAAEKHVGGKNIDANGAEITSAAIKDFILARDSFGIPQDALREVKLVYGGNWTEGTEAAIVSKFKAKFAELYDNAEAPYVCGVPSSKITAWRHNNEENNVDSIKMDFRYGDGLANADNGNGGNVNRTTLIYNVLDDTVRLLNTDKIFQKFEIEHRRMGAPVTEVGTFTIYGKDGEDSFNVAEADAKVVTAQIFETGIIYMEGSEAKKLEGLPILRGENKYEISAVVKDQDVRFKNNDNNNFSFIGDIDGIWHPLKTARAVVGSDNSITVYYNFVPGCLKVEYNADFTRKSAMRYAGYNFVKNASNGYDKAILPVENFTFKDEMLAEGGRVTGDALSNFQVTNPGATEGDVKAAFKAGYVSLVEDGFVPGYRCSDIKMWDLMVLDYKYGDGTTGFDSTGSGGRERITTLVYSPVKNAVYGVYGEYFNIFKNDSGIGRKVTGAPISKVLKNHIFDGKTFTEIQFYEQGYIYVENGNLKSVIGITAFDDDYSVKTIIPAPEVPGDFGAKKETKKSEDGRITYINYRYGAVKATQNKADTACVYNYYTGRNFEFTTVNPDREYLDIYLLPVSDFLGANGEKLTQKDASAAYKKKFDEDIKPLIISEYTKYHTAGIFLGFPEGKFGDWNGCDGMQFRWGDSTANPFNDGRNHMAMLTYNKLGGNFDSEELKDVPDELYLLKDAFMQAWASKWIDENFHTIVGVPVSNPYQLDGCNAWFQDFRVGKKNVLMVQGTSMGIAYYTDGTTAQDYVNAQNGLVFPTYPDGDKIPETDVTEKEEYQEKGCAGVAFGTSPGGTVGGIGAGLLIISLAFLMKKKSKKANLN